MVSDSILTDLGFSQTLVRSQIFVLVRNIQVIAIIKKIVDDLLIAGIPATTDPIIAFIAAKVELGNIVHETGHWRYFSINLHQHDDYYTIVDADYRLSTIARMPITRLRRSELYNSLSSAEARYSASLN